jgi:small subunit ribosomal protein S8e
VKSAIVDIDATPFRQWYESHVSFIHVANPSIHAYRVCAQYAAPIFRGAKLPEDAADAKQSNHVKRILDERKKDAKIDPLLEAQFKAGRLLAVITSRPGQSGRCDGYILEGKELDVSGPGSG